MQCSPRDAVECNPKDRLNDDKKVLGRPAERRQIPLMSQTADAPEYIARGVGDGEIPDPDLLYHEQPPCPINSGSIDQGHYTCRYFRDG